MSLIYSVEDDGNIAKIINKTLTKQGHEVLSFFNGKDFFYHLLSKNTRLNFTRYHVARYGWN